MSEEGTARLHEIADRLVTEAVAESREMLRSIFICGAPNCRGHAVKDEDKDGDRQMAGEIPEGAIAGLEALVTGLGYVVKYDWWTVYPNVLGETISLHASETDGDEVRDVHVKPRMSPASTLMVLAHEAAHVLAGDTEHPALGNWDAMSEAERVRVSFTMETWHLTTELRAFLTSFVVMEALGTPVSNHARSHLTGVRSGAILPAIRAEAIVHARRILAAIQPEDPAWRQ